MRRFEDPLLSNSKDEGATREQRTLGLASERDLGWIGPERENNKFKRTIDL